MKDIKTIIKKYDSQLDYISGYENCYSMVKCHCNRCGNTFERRWNCIARKDTDYSCPICQTKLGLERSKNNAYIVPLEERKEHFLKILEETQPHIIYRNGFENNKSIVSIRFKKCNHIHQISVDRLMRKNKPIYCQVCIKETNKQIKELLKQQRESIEEIKRQHRMEINNLYKEIKKNTIYITKCKCCNEDMYIHNRKKQICNRCKNKIKSNHSNKSLMQLYERDKGICYLCGKKCDYEDYVYRENTFIAGNYYPSIDHVIPLAKGGLDVWENLKLAHRICNSKKRDKLLIRPNA